MQRVTAIAVVSGVCAVDLPQLFWDLFRRRWRFKWAKWNDSRADREWTPEIISAAREACEDLGRHLRRELIIGCEGHGRLDVHAEDARTGALVVAFESELAYWGRKGDWSEEFKKLCRTRAELRVLSGTFKPGTGGDFSAFLKGCLESLRSDFECGLQEPFCLFFGPESSGIDPYQPWLVYSLDRGLDLRPLHSALPLIPRRIINGLEPADEDVALARN